MTKLPKETLERIEREADAQSNYSRYAGTGDEPSEKISYYIHMACINIAIGEAERAGELVEALGIAEKAIEALTLSQKESGMGILGTHIVVPETLRRIREALASYRTGSGGA